MSTLSLTGKRWILPEHTEALNASHVLVRLLADRGLNTEAELVSPGVFPDMLRAKERIETAVRTQEAICIFGDYDCDGITATAQLVRYFRRRNCTPYIRLPHRVQDGYGLNMNIAREIVDRGTTLLLTCDTGISSVQEIQWLSDNGVDVIVTDHHHLLAELPPAYAIIHPALSNHPLPYPSGAGVVFSLIRALEEVRWNGVEEDMALAMFGTVADLVELQGANRALTKSGLAALAAIHDGPIFQLRERSNGNTAQLSSIDVAFRIAPRLNAAGRMASPDIALQALLEGGDALDTLDALNEQRQDITRLCMEDALTQCDTTQPLLMTVSTDYPHGIVGLIAGKLTEAHGKPSLVAHRSGDTCTASLRSPAMYNIAEGLGRCSDLLMSYGGHAQAAGCTFASENESALHARLTEDILAHTTPEQLVPTLTVDAVLDATDVNVQFCKKLSMLEPYGQGNTEPLFLLRGVRLQDARSCGSDGSHLQARISGIKSIGFGMAELASEANIYDVIARIGISEWNERIEPQIFLQDLAVANTIGTKKAPQGAL